MNARALWGIFRQNKACQIFIGGKIEMGTPIMGVRARRFRIMKRGNARLLNCVFTGLLKGIVLPPSSQNSSEEVSVSLYITQRVWDSRLQRHCAAGGNMHPFLCWCRPRALCKWRRSYFRNVTPSNVAAWRRRRHIFTMFSPRCQTGRQ